VAGVAGVAGGGAWATTVGAGAATIPATLGLIAVPTTTPKPRAIAANVLIIWIGMGSIAAQPFAAPGGSPTPGGSA
jgi:hypothetical protein